MRIRQRHAASILIAVLVVSIVLATGLGVATIFILELRTSGLASESIKALYAAETGVEWQLYQLNKQAVAAPTLSNNTSFNAFNNTSIQLFYRFDEGSGTAALDASGNNFTGTLIGGPTWIAGKYGNAVNFDGTNDYVNSVDVDFPSGPFSVMAWFKTTSTLISPLWHKITNCVNQNYYTWINDPGAGNMMVGLYDGTGYKEVNTTGASYTDGNWHHVALVVTTATVELFVDGVSKGTAAHDNSIPTNDSTMTIGAQLAPSCTGNVFFAGAIDEVRVYNSALTMGQVQNAMANASPSVTITSRGSSFRGFIETAKRALQVTQ